MTVFAAVGRCIYCGTTEGPLGKEHVVPLALNGDLLLPRSSCSSCSAVTGKFEGDVLRHDFLLHRARYDFKTRRPNDRPRDFEVSLHPVRGKPDLERGEKVKIGAKQHPWVRPNVYPDFGTPGFVLGKMPWEAEAGHIKGFLSQAESENAVRIGRGRKSVAIKVSVNYRSFARMIAKISHSYAVAVLGVDGFKPFLLDLILNEHDRLNYFIGTPHDRLPKIDKSFWIRLRSARIRGQDIAVVDVRLFAWLDFPCYVALVGRPQGTKLREIGWVAHSGDRTA
jgi:hypothetical protein